MKELKIEPPEGYEVDKEHSTFECIKFKPIKPQLPKTWEEFCKTHPLKEGEAWITSLSEITYISKEEDGSTRFSNRYEHLLPSEKYAEAMLALCQLIQLRDCYNDGWKPDWSKEAAYECIFYCKGKIKLDTRYSWQCILVFKSRELRDTFYNNFKELIEQAKLLL